MRRLALLVLLGVGLVGCNRYSSSTLIFHAGYEASCTAMGDRPFLEIKNRGPSDVHVDLTVDGGTESSALIAGDGMGRGTSRGPIAARLTSEGDATVEVKAQRTDGLVVDGPRER
ncbi:MAG: hypothetical protein KDA28_09025 [Phycisphaerales bacterium]|nr:hypothetical protein [Phycisphaerales bacterium]